MEVKGLVCMHYGGGGMGPIVQHNLGMVNDMTILGGVKGPIWMHKREGGVGLTM